MAGFPSVAACWIAVWGRQKSQWSLFSQHEISASAVDTVVITKSRDCSLVDRCLAVAISRIPRWSIGTGLVEAQVASCACAGVRVEVAPPSDLTSLNSAAYSALVRGNGGPIRNWSWLLRVNGLTRLTHPKLFAFAGGTSRHSPGSVPIGKAYVPKRPSFARLASTAAAAAWPTAMPAASCVSGIRSRDAA